jgi:hypothetical protein
VRICILLGAILFVTAVPAGAASFLLICEFPGDQGAVSADEIRAIPYQLRVEYESKSVQLNGRVSAIQNLTDSEFSFSQDGFNYTVDRVAGSIRFFSPQGFEDWKRLEAGSIRGLVARGMSVADAQSRVASQRENSKFDHRLHSGKCKRADAAAF